MYKSNICWFHEVKTATYSLEAFYSVCELIAPVYTSITSTKMSFIL